MCWEVKKAETLGARIIKLAVHANCKQDVVRLLAFTVTYRHQNLVTISMGSVGSVSRLLFPLVGSLMTYTSLSPAHGQIPAKRLIDEMSLYSSRYHEELVRRLALPKT